MSFAKNSAGALEVTDTNNYYPFGLNHIEGMLSSSNFGRVIITGPINAINHPEISQALKLPSSQQGAALQKIVDKEEHLESMDKHIIKNEKNSIVV